MCEDMFTGIGCLEKPYHIKLDPTVQQVIIPPRRIPFGLEDRVKTALLDMYSQAIIVPVEKRNTEKLRICIDPRPSNKQSSVKIIIYLPSRKSQEG